MLSLQSPEVKELKSLTIVPPPGVLEGRHVGGVDGVDGVGGDEYKLSYC